MAEIGIAGPPSSPLSNHDGLCDRLLSRGKDDVVRLLAEFGKGEARRDANAWFNLGAALQSSEEAEAAVDAYRTALDLDYAHIDQNLKVQAEIGTPYTKADIENAQKDVVTQATADSPDAGDLAKRYPKVNVRDFDGNPKRVTEADALIAYLQTLGTLVDFKLYDDKANIR